MTRAAREQLEFATILVQIKHRAGVLGLYRTMHELDRATRMVGYEIAEHARREIPHSPRCECPMTPPRKKAGRAKVEAGRCFGWTMTQLWRGRRCKRQGGYGYDKLFCWQHARIVERAKRIQAELRGKK